MLHKTACSLGVPDPWDSIESYGSRVLGRGKLIWGGITVWSWRNTFSCCFTRLVELLMSNPGPSWDPQPWGGGISGAHLICPRSEEGVSSAKGLCAAPAMQGSPPHWSASSLLVSNSERLFRAIPQSPMILVWQPLNLGKSCIKPTCHHCRCTEQQLGERHTHSLRSRLSDPLEEIRMGGACCSISSTCGEADKGCQGALGQVQAWGELLLT